MLPTLEIGTTPAPPITPEELDRDPLGGATETYLHYRQREGITAESMQHNYSLLEPLLNAESSQDKEKPALTICMPVAINREDEATLMQALDAVEAAQQKFGRPVDIVLWTNAKYADDHSNEDEVSMEAVVRYQSLRDNLAQRPRGGLHIRTALQLLPESEATINQIRNNYMEAVAIDARERDLGYDHPVMWLDADTIKVSGKAFEQVVAHVRGFKELFVHPMTHYGIDWTDAPNLSQADAATKAAAMDEIMRRQRNRTSIGASGEPSNLQTLSRSDIYAEENGLAFAIGTFLSAGGIPVGWRGESSGLISSVLRRNHEAREHYAHSLGLASDTLPPHISMLPSAMANKLAQRPAGVLYLPETYVTMSARRQNSVVRAEGPSGLADMWTKNYRGMHVDTAPAADTWDDARISRDLSSYIAREIANDHYRQLDRRFTDRQRRRLANLLARYVDRTN